MSIQRTNSICTNSAVAISDFHEWLLVAVQGAQVISEDGRRYMYAVLPSTNSTDDIDDLEFLFSVSSTDFHDVGK